MFSNVMVKVGKQPKPKTKFMLKSNKQLITYNTRTDLLTFEKHCRTRVHVQIT